MTNSDSFYDADPECANMFCHGPALAAYAENRDCPCCPDDSLIAGVEDRSSPSFAAGKLTEPDWRSYGASPGERDVSLRFTQLDDLRSHLPKSDDRLLAGSTREYQIRPYGVAVHCAARRGGLPSAESKPKKRLTGAEYSSVWRPYLVGMDSAPIWPTANSDNSPPDRGRRPWPTYCLPRWHAAAGSLNVVI